MGKLAEGCRKELDVPEAIMKLSFSKEYRKTTFKYLTMKEG